MQEMFVNVLLAECEWHSIIVKRLISAIVIKTRDFDRVSKEEAVKSERG